MKSANRLLLALVIALGALVFLSWSIYLDVPNGFELTRFRNSLIASTGDPGDFNWRPENPPEAFRDESGEIPAIFQGATAEILGRSVFQSEFDLAVSAVDHLHRRRLKGGPIQSDTVSSYKQILAEQTGYCSDYTQVFSGLSHALNIAVREWGMSFDGFSGRGHAFSEIFDTRAGKWIFIDPFNAFYATDKTSGALLSATELRQRLLRDPADEQIQIVPIGSELIGFRSEEHAIQYYRKGASRFFLYFSNDVFTYDNAPVVRLLGPVSRAAEQLVSIMLGHHPRIVILPSSTTRDDVESLQELKGRIYLKSIGLFVVTLIVLCLLYFIIVGRRSSSNT